MNRRIFALAAVLLVTAGSLNAQKLKKSITWENFNVHPAQLPVIGQLQPKHSDGTGNSWWSVGCETLDRDYAIFDNYKQYVGETGVGYARHRPRSLQQSDYRFPHHPAS